MNQKIKLLLAIILPTLIMTSCNQGTTPTQKTVNLEDENQKMSYALAINVANSVKNGGFENIDADAFAQAIIDFKNDDSKIPFEETTQILNEGMRKFAEAKSAKSKEAGQAFLDENAKKEGVTTTDSGLQYEVISEGTGGAKPTAQDKVKVHYHGTLTDGTVFDSSVDRGEPISFSLQGVIRGWTEGLQLMSIGDKYKFTIPYDLAYGPQGNGRIPGYSTLIFEVELLDIESGN